MSSTQDPLPPERGNWGPVLLGQRVRLQPIGPALARAILAGTPEPELSWEEGFPMSPILGIARVIGAASAPLGPFLAYVVVRRSDELAIGDMGFHGPPNASGEVEIGYALVPAARGAGFAHEALALLIAWAWRQPAVAILTARVDPGNAPSVRVLLRLGFEFDRSADGMHRYVLEPSAA